MRISQPLSLCIWNPPHGPLELKPGEIHLWQADLGGIKGALQSLKQMLGPEELAKVGQFRVGLHRNRYIIRHAVLRTILARYVGTMPAERMFEYGPHGKPEIASGAVRFNMSHSDDLVICAVSRTCEVGVDVERMRPGVDGDVARCFSPEAARLLERLSPPARRRAFYQSWTRMEAYAKGCGEGLKANLEGFVSFLELSNPVLLPQQERGQPCPWWFHDFCPRDGYVATLAVPREVQIRLLELQGHSIANVQFDAIPAGTQFQGP